MEHEDEVDREPDELYRPNKAQYSIAAVIFALAAGWFYYVSLHDVDAQSTAALYVGLPALVAILIVLLPRAQTGYGMMVKAISIALALAFPLLGEGIICVLMISPLFYGIGIIVVAIYRTLRDWKMRSFMLLPLLIMSTEGVTPATTFNTAGHTSSSAIIKATPEQVAFALTQPMHFDADALPGYLSMGFPEPQHASGSPLEVGATRSVQFAGAHKRPAVEHPHHWGTNATTLDLVVADVSAGHVGFAATSDTTPIASWMQWKRANVDWQAVDAEHTRITWSFDFERKLSPAWYFQPWENYATEKAAEYLIDSLPVNALCTTPRDA